MRFDLLIRGAQLIDGTGAPRFAADIGVERGRIAAIGSLQGASAARELDAEGLIAAPGFIDAHTHDDRLLLCAPELTPKVSQGVTTVVAGNCGISLAPAPAGMRAPVVPPLDLLDDSGDAFCFPRFADYVAALRARPAAANCALLVGHTLLRAQVLDDLARPASRAQCERMRELADEALAAGAIGISTGLAYEPAHAAPTEEVIEVCRSLAARGGLYCTHLRDEGEQIESALEEAFRIGRELGVPIVLSHHKVAGTANHGRSVQTLARIAAAMRTQPVALDCYPYAASSTILSAERAAAVPRVLVTWSKPHPELAGRDLADIAAELGVSQAQAAERLLPAGAIYFSMDERDVQRILAFEHTMIGSDGLPHDAMPHPRLWGSFARVLGHYAREQRLFPLETAVHKMTGLPARTFGLADRGELAQGRAADLVLFDEREVGERASFAAPIQPAKGIGTVIVNGELVWSAGKPTGARPGQVLRRSA